MYNAMSLRARGTEAGGREGLGTARPPHKSYSATERERAQTEGRSCGFCGIRRARGNFSSSEMPPTRGEGGGVHVVQHWQHLLDVDKGSARNRYGHRRRRRPFGDCRQSSRRTFGQFCSRCLLSRAEARRSNGSCKLLSCIATIARTDGMQVTDLLANFGRCDVWRIGGTIQKERPQNFRIPYPTLCAIN